MKCATPLPEGEWGLTIKVYNGILIVMNTTRITVADPRVKLSDRLKEIFYGVWLIGPWVAFAVWLFPAQYIFIFYGFSIFGYIIYSISLPKFR